MKKEWVFYASLLFLFKPYISMDVTVDDLIAELKLVMEDIPQTIKDSIFSNQKQIIQLQRLQLYDGKNNKGEDIHPFYTEDSYFKTAKQAQGYIKWKQKITPNSNRNPNAPNLYINGYIHRNIILFEANGEVIFKINSSVNFADELLSKYDDLLGLNPDNQEKIENEIIIPDLWKLLEKYI